MRISGSVDLRHVTKHFSGFHAFFPFYLCHLNIIFPNPISLWDQWTQVATLVSRAFAFVFSWYKVIIALSLDLSSGALQHTVHISVIAKIFFELHYFGPDFEARSKKTWIPIRSVQNADCRLETGYKMQTRYKMQTADWIQNANWEFILFFRLIRDNMSSHNLRSVTFMTRMSWFQEPFDLLFFLGT